MRDALLDPTNGFSKAPIENPSQATADETDTESFSVVQRPPTAPPDLVSIHMFLQDRRYGSLRRSAVDIQLPAVSIVTNGTDQTVSVREILTHLQRTLSAIQGLFGIHLITLMLADWYS